MDAIQFGRWMANRRRQCGFRSQRALVEGATRYSMLSEITLSEDFLARLEAGTLAHPFRGHVRERVLALAWLLCQTPQDVKAYLRAAELSKLTMHENEQVRLLQEHLAEAAEQKKPFLDRRSPGDGAPEHWQRPVVLPPRPRYLIGRDAALQELLDSLMTMGMGLYGLTGMPGVGKSALAFEAMHRLSTGERTFPDGVAIFTCTERKGTDGLLSLLQELLIVFGVASFSEQNPTNAALSPVHVLNRVRLVLAKKRALLVLDDVDLAFPLRLFREAVLGDEQQVGRIILTTSRSIPSAAMMTQHLHLASLRPDDALQVFQVLLGRPFESQEVSYAQRICATLGFLPLALEMAATAVALEAIPLALLATHLEEHPLDPTLTDRDELRSWLAREVRALDPVTQQQYALLATLGVPSFGLESAAAIYPTMVEAQQNWQEARGEAEQGLPPSPGRESATENLASSTRHLASTAAIMGTLVRHSLLEPDFSSPQERTATLRPRYRFHPLFHAYAAHLLKDVPPEEVDTARHNAYDYALGYLRRYGHNCHYIKQEYDFLSACFKQALSTSDAVQTLHLVDGLAAFCRFNNRSEGIHLIQRGVEASNHLHDHPRRAMLLDHLGWLYCQQGNFPSARRVWTEALEMAESEKPRSLIFWMPLHGLAYLAHMHQEEEQAEGLTRIYLEHCQDTDEPVATVEAYAYVAFYQRLQGKRDAAYVQMLAGQQLYVQSRPMPTDATEPHILDLLMRAEMARIQGNYVQAQAYTALEAALAEEKEYPYILADLLFDQAYFAWQQGQYGDAHQLASHALYTAEQIGSPHLSRRNRQLLTYIDSRRSEARK
ncbi:MAG: hypothetical protein H0U76_24845 [Ktedonobacteraceae bacterium]|nr:hypothetical protein [Ktedonobacteraceae bacterium]